MTGPTDGTPARRASVRRIVPATGLAFALLYCLAIVAGFVGPERRLAIPEITLIALMVILVSDLLDRVAEISVGGAHLKLREKVEHVEAEQVAQRRDLDDIINLLVLVGLSWHEAEHLGRLDGDEPFAYEGRIEGKPFSEELRRLRDLSLIEARSGDVPGYSGNIRDIPAAGPDLRRYLRVTDRGRLYLHYYRQEGARRLLSRSAGPQDAPDPVATMPRSGSRAAPLSRDP